MKILSTMSRAKLISYLNDLQSDAGPYGSSQYENETPTVNEINWVIAEINKRELPMGGIETI